MRLSIRSSIEESFAYFRLIELGWRYRYLMSRRSITGLNKEEELQLASLRQLFEGDPLAHRRRSFRRFPVMLPAVVKLPEGLCHGVLQDFSGNGLYLRLSRAPAPGTSIQVKVGTPGEVEYLFTCTVIRGTRLLNTMGLGCCFACPPVEIRHPGNKLQLESTIPLPGRPQRANLQASQGN